MGRHQQCARAASGAIPQHLLRAHVRLHDRGTQRAVSAVSTVLNAIDLELLRGIRLAAAVKYGGAGVVVRLTLPLSSSSTRRSPLE